MKINLDHVICAAFLLIAAAGCSPKLAPKEAYTDEKVKVDLVAPPAAVSSDTSSAMSDIATLPKMAYDYNYTFTAEGNGADTLIKSDQLTCTKAGPAVCEMMSLTTDTDPDSGYGHKTLELRVTPQWLNTWQSGLNNQLAGAHARISHQSVASEDLSLQIVDLSAHLKNKLALRDRLVAIIKSNPGKISDLVEAETQLSQVQGDIDGSQSTLAVMQKRVATTHLTLAYQNENGPANRSVFAPVHQALRNVLSHMMASVGFLINALAVLLPIGIVAAPLIWIFRHWLRRRKKKTTDA